ncbi:hypothetical protein M427DRAFT_30756 [Gonapodya prolifera JEL478]|uniref:Uncharacterized protein n=1 Tax=Gonapodya prolifera (strain JEL478) TaxID=1344416 RepID=A0A139AK47_GONPJ|nr:hypothetical protein M427DRAFT_30756 [Gonapodya prolifera JEL478]|eukprot:KXS16924.1 hypothetical protein M427DRAFT_30756 [Gonapodya prolifera JEL478]
MLNIDTSKNSRPSFSFLRPSREDSPSPPPPTAPQTSQPVDFIKPALRNSSHSPARGGRVQPCQTFPHSFPATRTSNTNVKFADTVSVITAHGKDSYDRTPIKPDPVTFLDLMEVEDMRKVWREESARHSLDMQIDTQNGSEGTVSPVLAHFASAGDSPSETSPNGTSPSLKKIPSWIPPAWKTPSTVKKIMEENGKGVYGPPPPADPRYQSTSAPPTSSPNITAPNAEQASRNGSTSASLSMHPRQAFERALSRTRTRGPVPPPVKPSVQVQKHSALTRLNTALPGQLNTSRELNTGKASGATSSWGSGGFSAEDRGRATAWERDTQGRRLFVPFT